MKILFFILILLLPVSAIAGDGKLAMMIPMPQASKLLVPVAQHMRVDEGVFELEIGKTIDLTDRKILLSAQLDSRKECCILTLNGDAGSVYLDEKGSHTREVGKRYNLKNHMSTATFVQDKEVCFLDILDAVTPKGAPGIVTFRLNCL